MSKTNRRTERANLRRQRAVEMARRPEGVNSTELAAALEMSYQGATHLLTSAAADHGMCRAAVPCHRGWTYRYFMDIGTAQSYLGRPLTSAETQVPAAAQPEAVSAVPAAAPVASALPECEAEPAAFPRGFEPQVATGRVELFPVPTVPGWGRPPARRPGADDHRRYPHSLGGTTR